MRVPLSWLREYVPLPADTASLVERLTLAGLEASGVQVFGFAVPAGLRVKAEDAGLEWERDKVVVAKVLDIAKHPDADKLKLVKLEYGAGEPKTVVTGAPNIAPGQSGMKVVLGLRGTRYFYTDKDGKKAVFTLEPKALRGIMNDAMCMSNFELGISDEHEGIIILDDADPAPGTPVQDLLGDIVVELDVLPNMARCLSMIGIAREVAALTGATPTIAEPKVAASSEKVDGKVKVEIEDPKLCGRYSATIIRNVKVGPAPRWMRSRLDAAGMRPINSVVDITNYVMLEHGQPLHAFDYDVLVKRAGGKAPTIIVRPAKPGEKLKTLDGQNRTLSPENLVIADTAGPIALAGVMGGLETEVTDTTSTILLESASFDFVSVRKTARQFTLFSEASTRFSKGLHPEVVKPAAIRAAQLFHDHAGGEVLAGIVDNYPLPVPQQVIDLKASEIRRLLGFDIPAAEVERVLKALQFTIANTGDGWSVTTPPTRLDIQVGAADLIEELARVFGYDKLPESLLAQPLPEQRGNRSLELEEHIRDLLADQGLQECITYSLTSRELETKLIPSGSKFTDTPPLPPEQLQGAKVLEWFGGRNVMGLYYVGLLNPISPERSVMRSTLVPGLLEVAARNLTTSDTVALYELGPVYIAKLGETLPIEPRRLALVLCGRRTMMAWDDPQGVKLAQYDFFDLKGAIEALLSDLHIPNIQFAPNKEVPWLHPIRTAEVCVSGKSVGVFGELHPKVAANLMGDTTKAARPERTTDQEEIEETPAAKEAVETVRERFATGQALQAEDWRKLAAMIARHSAGELAYIRKELGFTEVSPKQAAQVQKIAQRATEKHYSSIQVLVAEFDLEAILAAVPDRFPFKPIPTAPPAKRDIAMIVPADTPAETVLAEIRAAGGDLLADAVLFDVYTGESIPAGTKSLAFALVYQAPDRTLSDKEIEKAHQKIEGRLRHVLKAQIRGKDA